jgi:hypothetical protein
MMGIYAITYHPHLLAKKYKYQEKYSQAVIQSDFDPFE